MKKSQTRAVFAKISNLKAFYNEYRQEHANAYRQLNFEKHIT